MTNAEATDGQRARLLVRMSDYTIIQCSNKDLELARAEVDETVNRHIRLGWVPLGGVSVFGASMVSQADQTYYVVSQALTIRKYRSDH